MTRPLSTNSFIAPQHDTLKYAFTTSEAEAGAGKISKATSIAATEAEDYAEEVISFCTCHAH
jgi:hypothetical protein